MNWEGWKGVMAVAAFLIFVPLIGLIVLNLPFGFLRRFAFAYALTLAACQAALAIFLPLPLWNRVLMPFFGLETLPLSVDHLSIVLLLSVAITMLAALPVGYFAARGANRRFEFVCLAVLAVSGMNGIAMVHDLFSLYVFIEVTTVSCFVLIALARDKDGLEGGFKYLVLSAVASAAMLTAIALLLMTSGSTSFMAVRAMLEGNSSIMAKLSIAVFVVGLFIKGGVVPFHGWLPDAYTAAPAGVTVLMAGIATKTTGVYILIRLFVSVFGKVPHIQSVLLFAGALTIVVGAVAAFGQKDFKRMLAYSSISQMGYIVLSLGAGSALGIAGAVFHLFNHAVFKSQLFVNAAAVEEQTGTRDMDTMGGLSARMPVTGATSVVAFLSTAGVPPLAGFWSKLIIVIAVWNSGNRAYAVISVLACLLTCAYFLSMQRRVFFGALVQQFSQIQEARLPFLLPEMALTLITIGVGVFFPRVLNTFILQVRAF
jgi:multicomponent Na+:H+ antiporter subunit D